MRNFTNWCESEVCGSWQPSGHGISFISLHVTALILTARYLIYTNDIVSEHLFDRFVTYRISEKLVGKSNSANRRWFKKLRTVTKNRSLHGPHMGIWGIKNYIPIGSFQLSPATYNCYEHVWEHTVPHSASVSPKLALVFVVHCTPIIPEEESLRCFRHKSGRGYCGAWKSHLWWT